MVNVVRQLTSPVHHTKSLVVADSKFESAEVMQKGKDEWGTGFVMSQVSNPVCHPEQWRSKKGPWWKRIKKSTRGNYVQVFSNYATFTMMRDSSVLRVVDNDLRIAEEERVVKVWDKEKRVWGGYRKVMAPHFYKSFYGMVDVHNGLRSRYGLDWSTQRKMFRVNNS